MVNLLRNRSQKNEKGFTLVELLMAAAIFGIVLTAMYGVYIGMQGGTYNQEEVLDLQQSLRYASDLLGRDIEMAGMLGVGSVNAGSGSTQLNLSTLTTLYRFARIAQDTPVSAGTIVKEFTVAVPEMADRFDIGDTVRIYRPSTGLQPIDPAIEFVVAGKNRTTPSITIENFNNTAEIWFRPGDLIVQIRANAPPTPTISWSLDGTDLVRSVNGGAGEVIATNISSIAFRYINAAGNEFLAPNAPVAVRVTLTADTQRQSDRQVRRREIRSLFRLMN